METFKNHVHNLLRWAEERSVLLDQLGIETNLLNLIAEFEEVEKKNAKTDMDIVFTGKTSSGKSLLINNLLGIEVVRSGVGHTTSSAIRIQTTSSPSSYYQFYNEEKRHDIDFSDDDQIDDFHDKADVNADSNTYQCVKVFLSKNILKQESIISDKVGILDTPGMDQKVFKDEEVKRNVVEADALIIVVDIVTWSSSSAIKELLNDKSFFVRPSVIVAINKSDTLLEEKRPKRRDNIKKNIKKEMSELAVFKDRKSTEIDNSIFFVSAKLMSKLSTSDTPSRNSEEEKKMVAEFNKFEQTILSTARWNCEARKMERIRDAFERCRENLKSETKKMASDISMVEACFHQLSNHIRESTSKVNETVNRDFVKSACIKDLHELKSGRDKVVAFLNHCAKYYYEDIRRTIIRQQVEDRIAKFVENTIREEVNHITFHDTEHIFEPFFDLLDPVDFDNWSFEDEQKKIVQRIQESKESCAKKLEGKKESLHGELREFVERKKKAMEDSLEDIRKDIEALEKKARELKEWDNSWGSTFVAVGTLGISKLLSYSEKTSIEEDIESKTRQMNNLKQDFDEEVHAKEESRQKKLLRYTKEQEKQRVTEQEQLNEETTKSILRNMEQEKQIQKYKESQSSTMVQLYIRVITFVSESVEMRIDSTAKRLKMLKLET